MRKEDALVSVIGKEDFYDEPSHLFTEEGIEQAFRDRVVSGVYLTYTIEDLVMAKSWQLGSGADIKDELLKVLHGDVPVPPTAPLGYFRLMTDEKAERIIRSRLPYGRR